MKKLIIEAIDNMEQELLTLSHNIHGNPELSFTEKKAVKWQIELLAKYGFQITTPYCGLETSYRATFSTGKQGPRIAILAEYDALSEIGHGCGHNIIAASAVGAGIGLSKVLSELCGEVVVIGTPAEEGGGGKIILVDKGAFSDIDFVMMMHPSTKNLIGRGGLAAVSVNVEYSGKAAHSSSPETGINALTSLITLFNNIDTLRQVWQAGTKINGIITSGGVASNIIPDFASASFTVRAHTRKYLLSMVEDIKKAAQAAGLITGAKSNVIVGLIYAERYSNLTMGETFKNNMELLGEMMNYPLPDEPMGSSDIGNVSLVVPTIHEYLSIAEEKVNAHSLDFCQASISIRADEVVLKAAKGLAMTAYDIMKNAELQKKIYREFKEKVIPFQ